MNEAGTSAPRLLTVGEVAERLRVSPATVRRWCRTGDMKSTRPGGIHNRTLRIPATEVARVTADLDDDQPGESPAA